MENKTTFMRDKGESWTLVPNIIIQDKRLNSDAKIIMIIIISNIDNWIINRNEIEKRIGMPVFKFRKGWDLLKKYKYIEMIRRKGYVHWIVNEAPAIDKGNNSKNSPITQHPSTIDKGIIDKGNHLIRTNLNKDQYLDTKSTILRGEEFNIEFSPLEKALDDL